MLTREAGYSFAMRKDSFNGIFAFSTPFFTSLSNDNAEPDNVQFGNVNLFPALICLNALQWLWLPNL